MHAHHSRASLTYARCPITSQSIVPNTSYTCSAPSPHNPAPSTYTYSASSSHTLVTQHFIDARASPVCLAHTTQVPQHLHMCPAHQTVMPHQLLDIRTLYPCRAHLLSVPQPTEARTYRSCSAHSTQCRAHKDIALSQVYAHHQHQPHGGCSSHAAQMS
ncbi:hypothetical protein T492DRAFT_1022063 [Pavlovales sp. CCMP2436]|nr:hypothetical protein T492DRAFT_1022063 [Pavlovales sp. CCMP2436]